MSVLLTPQAISVFSLGLSQEAAALEARLRAHSLDDPGHVEPFSGRLAREQQWTLEFARGAIEEYKRFVLLAVTAPGPMTPSDAVDQVWHQHLTYTHDYWGTFCEHVLRQKLHHRPSAGGASQLADHCSAYAATLLAYEQAFGEPPPRKFWPPPEVRFAASTRYARVDIQSGIVVSVHRTLAWGLGLAAYVLAVSLAARYLGQGSLALVAISMCGTALGAAVLIPLVQTGLASGKAVYHLDPYELAYLANGEVRVMQAALGSLHAQGALTADSLGRNWSLAGPIHAGATTLEKAIYARFAAGKSWELQELRRDVEPLVTDLEMCLRTRGLTHAGGSIIPLLMALTVPLFAVADLAFGEHAQPGSALPSFFVAVFGVLAAGMVFPKPETSPAGKASLLLRRSKPRTHCRGNMLEPGVLQEAVALDGVQALKDTGCDSTYSAVAAFPVSRNTVAGEGCGSCGGCGCG